MYYSKPNLRKKEKKKKARVIHWKKSIRNRKKKPDNYRPVDHHPTNIERRVIQLSRGFTLRPRVALSPRKNYDY